MGMILSSTYRNLTAGTNVDRAGKVLIDLADALVATGKWRWKHQGDGLSMYSTATTRAFTANTVGYITNGTPWITGGGANSFSNLKAYYVLEELDENANATGRQFLAQRHTGNASSVVNMVTLAFSWTGFTGAATANTAPTGGTWQRKPTSGVLNSGGTLDLFSGMSGSYQISQTGTVVYSIWVPDGLSGTTGNVAPFKLVIWDATIVGNDYGTILFYEALNKAAAADAHPCVVCWNTWANVASETGNTTPLTYGVTSQTMFSVNASGSIVTCAWPSMRHR